MYAMFQRYMDIEGFLRFLDDREVESMLPTVSQDREISDLLATLDDLHSATVALQDSEISLSGVRAIFDEAIKAYPQAIVPLGDNSEIVENVDFKIVLVKILRGTTSSLIDGQKLSVGRLVVSSSIGDGAALQRLTIAERAKKRQKLSDEGTKYIDCRLYDQPRTCVSDFPLWRSVH
ncbi:hypothetical protein LEN26_020515 [Aphanomyces euteiches]|nr:hypothetical protein LEN26_020515 [Aphanomyces euteiches]KAH9119335.1 hypothetical protein AeMF1_007886 [Aphanomyces euteiches]